MNTKYIYTHMNKIITVQLASNKGIQCLVPHTILLVGLLKSATLWEVMGESEPLHASLEFVPSVEFLLKMMFYPKLLCWHVLSSILKKLLACCRKKMLG
jgi:hypothetical protein